MPTDLTKMLSMMAPDNAVADEAAPLKAELLRRAKASGQLQAMNTLMQNPQANALSDLMANPMGLKQPEAQPEASPEAAPEAPAEAAPVGAGGMPLKTMTKTSMKVSGPAGDQPEGIQALEDNIIERLMRPTDTSAIDAQLADAKRDRSFLEEVNLKPLAALTDSWTGGRLADTYQAPLNSDQRKAQIAALEQAKRKAEDEALGSKLSFLKMTKDNQSKAEAMASRMEMAGMRNALLGQRGASNDEKSLRSEWRQNPVTKDTFTLRSAFGKIETAANENSSTGDLALIYAYMKMLDPGSVTRESEFALAEKTAGGTYDLAKQWLVKVQSGNRLSPEARKRFLRSAQGVLNSQLSQQRLVDEEYGQLAGRKGVDGQNVVLSGMTGTGAPKSSGRVKVVNRKTGESFEVDQNDVAAAKGEGFEVMK